MSGIFYRNIRRLGGRVEIIISYRHIEIYVNYTGQSLVDKKSYRALCSYIKILCGFVTLCLCVFVTVSPRPLESLIPWPPSRLLKIIYLRRQRRQINDTNAGLTMEPTAALAGVYKQRAFSFFNLGDVRMAINN